MNTSRRLRIAALAGGILASTIVGFGQSNAVLRVYVALVDSDLNVKPVPRHVMFLRSANGAGDAARLVTGFDGRAEIRLTAGTYILESDQPVEFRGQTYRWRQTILVQDNVPTSIELSNDNAGDNAPTVVTAPPAQPTPTTVAPAPLRGPDVRGTWAGFYGDYTDSKLIIDKQDGATFSGTLVVMTKSGGSPSRVQVEGRLTDRAVSISEIKLIDPGSAASWDLGEGSGSLQPGGQRMTGTGRAGVHSYRWAFQLRGKLDTPPAGPSPNAQADAPAPPAIAAAPDLRGVWQGKFAGFPAELRIDKQDGPHVSGSFVVTIFAGKAPFEVQMTGSLNEHEISIQEVGILKRGDGVWSLGPSTGTIAADGKAMQGAKRAGGTIYQWTFTRK